MKLYKERSKYNDANLRLIRIEQLFPLDVKQINEIVEKYQPKEIIWVQEEPENMGAENMEVYFIAFKKFKYKISL